MVESKENKKIKYLKSLNLKKHRLNNNQYFIEGIKLVNEALRIKAKIQYILINEIDINNDEILKIVNECNKFNIEYYIVKQKIFKELSSTVNSQGIIAIVNISKYNFEEIIGNSKMIIFCDRIQDPGNLGTIVRTTEAFGPGAVILSPGCVDVYNPKTVRSTAGALLRMPILNCLCSEQTLLTLKNNGFKIISTVVNASKSFEDIEKFDKICLVIGNEGKGVSQNIKELSDSCIKINMTGKTESLNASIAAGICIYEISKIIRKML